MNNSSWLFALRGTLSTRQKTVLGILGLVLFLFIWHLLTMGETPFISSGILPSPFKVLNAYRDLYYDNELVKNVFRSIGLNLSGYVVALVIAIPVGFLIGLYPLFNGMFHRFVDAIRFTPITAVTSLFIIWFGIGTEMKVYFLAFGIMIYLLPIVVQRINEVNEVYIKTVYTLGANSWKTIRSVYIPSVLSRLSDDIRVLTAISWTYIIVVENIASQGGLGPLIYRTGQRMGRIDKIFAGLVLIILIGAIQDRIFVYLDKEFFPHKYQNKGKFKTSISTQQSLLKTILNFTLKALVWALIGFYFILAINEYWSILSEIKILDYLFGDTIWVIHLIFIGMLFYKSKKWYTQHFQSTEKVLRK